MNARNIPNLQESVLAALELFSKNQPPRLNLKQFNFPLIVGSGNAYNTALVIFGGQAAIICNESNFKKTIDGYEKLIKNKIIQQAIIISASGEKDSVWEIKLAKKNNLKTILLTCSPQSTAAQLADQTLTYQKLPEPYTYNVSTYLGIILSTTQEDSKKIKKFITSLKLPKNFSQYQAYSFILPDELSAIAPMLEIKRNELFGPHLSLRACSFGEARHARFVHPWDKELIISLGKNKYFGDPKHRWEIKIPNQVQAGLIMSLTYYLIGKIQEAKPAYFKKNIAKFCQIGPRPYGSKKPFPIIVK